MIEPYLERGLDCFNERLLGLRAAEARPCIRGGSARWVREVAASSRRGLRDRGRGERCRRNGSGLSSGTRANGRGDRERRRTSRLCSTARPCSGRAASILADGRFAKRRPPDSVLGLACSTHGNGISTGRTSVSREPRRLSCRLTAIGSPRFCRRCLRCWVSDASGARSPRGGCGSGAGRVMGGCSSPIVGRGAGSQFSLRGWLWLRLKGSSGTRLARSGNGPRMGGGSGIGSGVDMTRPAATLSPGGRTTAAATPPSNKPGSCAAPLPG